MSVSQWSNLISSSTNSHKKEVEIKCNIKTLQSKIKNKQKFIENISKRYSQDKGLEWGVAADTREENYLTHSMPKIKRKIRNLKKR